MSSCLLRRARCFVGLSRTGVILCLAGVILMPGAVPAIAAGYALREQSTSGLGNALAGNGAAAEDASSLFSNPAGVTRLEGNQLLLGGALLIPDARFRNGQASTARGVGLSGNDGGQDIAPDVLIPAFYALWDLKKSLDLEQNIKVGLAVNVPFGLESDYADGWIGRYYALHSKLVSTSITPTISYEIIDGLSISAGPQFQYIDARLTNAIDFGSLGQASRIPGSRPGQQDGRASVTGDDWGYGYSLGMMYEPAPGTRFGAAFRSKIEQTLRGHANFRLDSAGIGAAISRASGAFTPSKANAAITTPWTASFGFYHDITDQWAIMGTLERTGWSSFRDLTVKFSNPAQPDNVSENDWNDTWFGAMGVTYRPTAEWTLRIGGAWDEGASPNDKRTPRIPTDDRGWFAVGAGYRPLPNVQLDFGYAHVFFQDASINLSAAQSGNATRGNLSGDVETSADIISLQARLEF